MENRDDVDSTGLRKTLAFMKRMALADYMEFVRGDVREHLLRNCGGPEWCYSPP